MQIFSLRLYAHANDYKGERQAFALSLTMRWVEWARGERTGLALLRHTHVGDLSDNHADNEAPNRADVHPPATLVPDAKGAKNQRNFENEDENDGQRRRRV